MFELDPEDIIVLGEPAFNSEEPLTSAQALHTRAGSRSALNYDRELETPPVHADAMALRSSVLSVAGRLGAIMTLTERYLPTDESVARQAEAFLRDQ